MSFKGARMPKRGCNMSKNGLARLCYSASLLANVNKRLLGHMAAEEAELIWLNRNQDTNTELSANNICIYINNLGNYISELFGF